ncbi:TIGR03936 family radical SAM-associated protein [Alkaliphilus oremlandii]|uniref:DUF2344 domain-containing protein n=1 Tax=Alkaliphilus oremlandii (strain OhILAs) TaxID=350688 RepID=A8MHL3_ALKOO|nr:TIGR03936 family radical SAM-associated protein [Alkaliphilus oremlandii]ABW19295.1 conserved hypothetical protein [Alkaliphilus oremlandii OhILAs]
MVTIRSRFYKKGDMVFISHLDLVRVFERAIRRANIPVDYTQGFNPRPIMAFATALGVGVASDGEYIDVQLMEEMDAESFKDSLNHVLPEGLGIIKSLEISSKEQSLMSVVASSTYLVQFRTTELLEEDAINHQIKEFLAEESIIEIKEKKDKKNKGNHRNKKPVFSETNIRPWIHSITLFSLDQHTIVLKMDLAAGSQGNLKPEVVVQKMDELEKISIILDSVRIHRLDLFKEENGENKTPLDGLDTLK